MANQPPKWLDKSAYPFHSKFLKFNGHNLHYIDEGEGETLLFVHGTPSWSFDFRNVILQLKDRYRCIALDHIGFGLSGKPSGYDYSTQNHSCTLGAFVEKLNLENFTLVMHDFGGPIGVDFMLRNPGKANKMVFLNTWLWSSEGEPEFEKVKKVLKSPLLPFLYKWLNFSPRFILPKSFGDNKLSSKIKQQYTKPFANRKEREGALAFAKSLLEDQGWFESLWQRKEEINRLPTKIVWGMKDPVIKPQNLEKLISGFPNAKVLRLPTAGHFPQEEKPGEVADFIAT